MFTEHKLRQLKGSFLTDLYTTRLLFAPEESPPAGHLKECRFKAQQSNAQAILQPCLMKPTYYTLESELCYFFSPTVSFIATL